MNTVCNPNKIVIFVILLVINTWFFIFLCGLVFMAITIGSFWFSPWNFWQFVDILEIDHVKECAAWKRYVLCELYNGVVWVSRRYKIWCVLLLFLLFFFSFKTVSMMMPGVSQGLHAFMTRWKNGRKRSSNSSERDFLLLFCRDFLLFLFVKVPFCVCVPLKFWTVWLILFDDDDFYLFLVLQLSRTLVRLFFV